MPNTIAYIMLLLWPLAALVFFLRLSVQRAVLACLVGGYLLLPPIAAFDLPMIPDLDKFTIASIMSLLGCLLVAKAPVPVVPRSWAMRCVAVIFILSPLPTVMVNSEAIHLEGFTLPGLTYHDMASDVIHQIIVLIPFFIARRHLSTAEAHRDILLAFCIGALIYSIPALIEIRTSPRMNIWVYGFFQHEFKQMVRGGGFRPLVFLPHALWLALFMATAVMSATALARAQTGDTRIRLWFAAFYLFGVLVLCKSLASLAYGLAFTPLIALAPFRLQIKVALIIAAFACLYPLLRSSGLIPVDMLVDYFASFNPARAQSLGFRFDNEHILLEHAADKRLFGWGGWGRNLIVDPQTGQMLSVPDGHWIIKFGTYGWLGYLSEMSLLAGTLALLHISLRGKSQADVSPYISCIALILGATLVDMLVNDTLVPVTWMCAGAILGYAERSLYPDLFRPRQALFGGRQVIAANAAGARLTPHMK